MFREGLPNKKRLSIAPAPKDPARIKLHHAQRSSEEAQHEPIESHPAHTEIRAQTSNPSEKYGIFSYAPVNNPNILHHTEKYLYARIFRTGNKGNRLKFVPSHKFHADPPHIRRTAPTPLHAKMIISI
ncbi:hypothetical protein [Labrenzia sp. 011]|uniref:hypothetical protein n=1 Tax=Labrenzia sp. 011 TaxID=2171494 RepID=UPI00105720CA|nr:hypothetical protein [Labrenzia sp. 011]